jgi:hypothetical protein
VGNIGASYDKALAESVIGLRKTEVIRREGPWKCFDDVGFATLDWVCWYNDKRLLKRIGDIPPGDTEQMYYLGHRSGRIEVGLNQNGLRPPPGTVHRSAPVVRVLYLLAWRRV